MPVRMTLARFGGRECTYKHFTVTDAEKITNWCADSTGFCFSGVETKFKNVWELDPQMLHYQESTEFGEYVVSEIP